MVTIHVNGKEHRLDLPEDSTLLWVLREHLGLTGTKFGCGIGECGSCVVHVDGIATRSCSVTLKEVQGKRITTIEGLPENHPVKVAWIEEQVVQCGYCQPGAIMELAALIGKNKDPKPEEISAVMDKVICRCGTYPAMKRGIQKALQLAKKEGA